MADTELPASAARIRATWYVPSSTATVMFFTVSLYHAIRRRQPQRIEAMNRVASRRP